MKKRYWRHGGTRTPQYYCRKCDYTHSIHSDIGKRHLRYARK